MDFLLFIDFSDWLVLLLSLVVLGACSGFLAGLLGVGGGIVLVPGLFYIFQFLGFPSADFMHLFIGTSLAIIIVNGTFSVMSHNKRGAVDFMLVKHIGVGIIFGVFLGTVFVSVLSGATLKLFFAIVLLFLAIIMIVNPARFILWHKAPNQLWMGVAGVVIGCISTLIGIGGGSLSVPFISFCRVPIHRAIGTAAALGLVISIPAVLGFIIIGWGVEGLPPYSLGYISVPAWAFIIPTSILSIPFGVTVSHLAPVPVLRKIFAGFMIIVACKMWMDVL